MINDISVSTAAPELRDPQPRSECSKKSRQNIFAKDIAQCGIERIPPVPLFPKPAVVFQYRMIFRNHSGYRKICDLRIMRRQIFLCLTGDIHSGKIFVSLLFPAGEGGDDSIPHFSVETDSDDRRMSRKLFFDSLGSFFQLPYHFRISGIHDTGQFRAFVVHTYEAVSQSAQFDSKVIQSFIIFHKIIIKIPRHFPNFLSDFVRRRELISVKEKDL